MSIIRPEDPRHYARSVVMAFIAVAIVVVVHGNCAARAQAPELQSLTRTDVTNTSEPIDAVCRRHADDAAAKHFASAAKQRAHDIAYCGCMGGLPVPIVSVAAMSTGAVGCATPLGYD